MNRQNCVRELVEELESEREDARKNAVVWLSLVGDGSALPHLERMEQDPSSTVRYFARRALDNLRGRVAELPMESSGEPEQLLRSEIASERNCGAFLCVARPDMSLRGPLVEALAREPDGKIRATMVRAIGSLGDASDLPTFFRCLRDPDPRVRLSTIASLASFSSGPIVEAVALVVGDADTRVQSSAIQFISSREESEAQAALDRMLESGKPLMQQSAVNVLAKLGHDWCRERLARVAGDESLAHLSVPVEEPSGSTPSVPGGALPSNPVASVTASGPTKFSSLTAGLGELLAFEDWSLSLASEDYRQRLHAVQNARLFPRHQALLALRVCLAGEGHTYVQAALAKALGAVGDPEDLERLTPFLASPDARIRANAAEGLAGVGTAEALDAIKPLFNDSSARVRCTAARLLFARYPREARAALQQMVSSNQPQSISSALHALQGLGEEEACLAFGPALNSSSGDARATAVEVLSQAAATSELARALMRQFGIDSQPPPASNKTAPASQTRMGKAKSSSKAAPRAGAKPAFASNITLTGSWVLPPKGDGSPPPRQRVSKITPAAVVEKPGTIGRMLNFARSYSLLLLPAVLLATLAGLVIYRAALAPEPASAATTRRKLGAGQGASILERMATAAAFDSYLGLSVRWTGRLVGTAEDGKVLQVQEGKGRFDTRFDRPAGTELKVGSRVRVDGIVRGRNGTVVSVEGRGVPVVLAATGQTGEKQ